MALIEWDPQIIPGLKLGLHSFQIIATFILWVLEIAVFRGHDTKVVGLNGWTFAVCFLSVPAWVYLVMTPRFDRTRVFASPHAMFAIDILLLILWISAFATQAAYNSADLCGSMCGISKGIVGLGVLTSLLWGGSSLVSAYTLQYYSFHNTLPGYDNRKIRGGDRNSIDPDKAAFSMAPHDDEAYERVHADDHDDDHGNTLESRYGAANPYSEADEYGGALPARGKTPPSLFDAADTEYASPAAGLGLGLGYRPTPSPRPLDDDEPAHFPSGHYDRIET